MCETIHMGFEPHLQRKREVPLYVSIFPVDSPNAFDQFLIVARLGMGVVSDSVRVSIPAIRLPSQNSYFPRFPIRVVDLICAFQG